MWPHIQYDVCEHLRVEVLSTAVPERCACAARDLGVACTRKGQCVEARVSKTGARITMETFTDRGER